MREISAQEAHDLLEKEPQALYLDVRSTPEFAAGRPRGARHAALLERPDPASRLVPNPHFLDEVKALAASDRLVICGCQRGSRSARAALLLEGSGYSRVFNMRGGFSGARDPASGEILEPGWVQLGFPVEQG